MVEEGWRQSGVGAEIAARIMEQRVRLSRRAGRARLRQGRADALRRQSRKARAAVGRRGGRGGQSRLLPVRMIAMRYNAAAIRRRLRARPGRARGDARRGPSMASCISRCGAASTIRTPGGWCSSMRRVMSRASTRTRSCCTEDARARAHPRGASSRRSASRPKARRADHRDQGSTQAERIEGARPVFDALHVPPAALEQGGVEVLRAAIVDGALHVSLRRAFDDPEAWGMLIADITRHVGAHLRRTSVREDETARAHPRDLRCRDGRADRSRHHQRIS